MPTVLTLQSKQKRMLQFYNSVIPQHNDIYIAIGYSTMWGPGQDPIVPLETDTLATYNTLVYGYQTYKNILFAKPIVNPTEEQKQTAIYYKDVYYDTISDYQQALDEGYTRILLRFVLDKDEYSEIANVPFDVIGMYTGVDPGDISDKYFITVEEFESEIASQGVLELISTRGVITRSDDQIEEVIILLEF
ncbi:MAG: hypothetical protein J6T15_05155 [Bacilli bacterium]|nr:hypothetical protein [Bacilli bacterium]